GRVARGGERRVVRVGAAAGLAGVRIAGPVLDHAVDAAVPHVVGGGVGLGQVIGAVAVVEVRHRPAEAEVGARLVPGEHLAVHGDRAAAAAVAEPQLGLGDHLGRAAGVEQRVHVAGLGTAALGDVPAAADRGVMWLG